MALNKVWTQAIVILVLAWALVACGATPEPVAPAPDADLRARAAEANAAERFDVAEAAAVLHLVIEARVTAKGVETSGVTIVRGPAKANSALPDLMVRSLAGEEVLAAYTTPDPRLAEIEGERHLVLDVAQTYVYAPLSADLTAVEIKRADGAPPDVTRGAILNTQPLLWLACRERPELEECQKVLEKTEGVRAVLAGKPFDVPLTQEAMLSGVAWGQASEAAFPDRDAAVAVEVWQGALLAADARQVAYDQRRAIELLAEAGYVQGFPIYLVVPKDDDALATMAAWVARSLGRTMLGVEQIEVDPDQAPDVVAELAGTGEGVLWLSR